MIYRNKIERKNQQQLHLRRCLWFVQHRFALRLITDLLPIILPPLELES